MFLISVFIGDNVPAIRLGFKGQEGIDEAVKKFTELNSLAMGTAVGIRQTVVDDFGQVLNIGTIPVAFLIQDLAQAGEIDIECGIYGAVTQAKAQVRASTNPDIVAARRALNPGPGVFTPNMGGPMNGRGY